MRWAAALLLLAACAQVPKQEGWQDTPTDSRVKDSSIIIVVWVWPFGVSVVHSIGHEVDQSGAVGGGTAKGQRAEQTTEVEVDAEVPIKP